MFRWLAHNLGNILLSIGLAVVVWVIAENEANPNQENTFTAIPIGFVNQPPDTVAYDASAVAVDVTLSAPETTLATLSARVISATLDLSATTSGDGLYRVSVGVPESLRRTVRVVRVEPASISVKVEPRRSVHIPVEVSLVGEPPVGYRVGRIVMRPVTVTVTGPESWVGRVAQAAGEFSVQNASAPLSQTLALKPVDADGQTVPHVKLEPERAALNVNIEQLVGFANLAVKVELTGTQASGYRLLEVNVTPPNVTVQGAPSALAALPGFVETESIDITGAQADIDKEMPLDLPPEVALVGQQSVRVRVKIEPISGSLIVPIRPVTIGLQSGLAARVSPETVDVILQGALPVLETIVLEQDVRVILDLTDLGIGTHQIEPRIETPPGIVAQNILPPTVQVIIERAPRGTPTPSPSPTPTKRP